RVGFALVLQFEAKPGDAVGDAVDVLLAADILDDDAGQSIILACHKILSFTHFGFRAPSTGKEEKGPCLLSLYRTKAKRNEIRTYVQKNCENCREWAKEPWHKRQANRCRTKKFSKLFKKFNTDVHRRRFLGRKSTRLNSSHVSI